MSKRSLLVPLPLAAFVVVGGVAVAQSIDNSGRDIPYSGRLELDGAPVNGAVDLRFDLYASATAPSPCDTKTVAGVAVNEGSFALLIPDVDDACLAGGELWFDLAVGEAGSGSFTTLASANGARTRVGAVPFATAVPKSSSFLVGTGEIALDDPESGARYTLKGSDDVAPDHGVALRALTNPPPGEPLFRVLSEGGAERLRVEHDGNVEIDNGLVVTGSAAIAGNVSALGDVSAQGDVAVDGRLTISEVDVYDDPDDDSRDGASGCQRIGEVMQCWGRSSPVGGGFQQVTWRKPFANPSYVVSCTPSPSSNLYRTVVLRGNTTSATQILVFEQDGSASGVGAHCIAMGLGGEW